MWYGPRAPLGELVPRASLRGRTLNIRSKLGKAGTFIAGRGKLATAGIIAVGLAIGGAAAADAATGITYPLVNNSVGSGQIVNRSIQSYDMNSALVNALLAVPTNGVNSSAKVAPGAIDETDLNAALQKKVNAVGTGTPGKSYGCDGKIVDATHPAAKCPGTDGKAGANGTDGVTKLEADSPYPSATQLADHEGNGANSTVKFVGDKGATLQRAWVQCADGKSAIGGGFQRADESVASIKNLQIVTSAATQIKDGKEVYNPIEGDAAGSVKPNAWLVEGFNNGDTDLIVRPSVVCAVVTP